MSALKQTPQPVSLSEHLADLAVDALMDEANLSPKPALVDRRGNGAHTDLHLGLMHASALSLWPTFKLMAEAAAQFQSPEQHCAKSSVGWAAKVKPRCCTPQAG